MHCWVLPAGALLAGGGHFLSTAKKLSEEGIDPGARVRALPIAVSSCNMSSFMQHWRKAADTREFVDYH
jgi:hypothetical protein